MANLSAKVEAELEQVEPLVRDVDLVHARFQFEARRFVRSQERMAAAKAE